MNTLLVKQVALAVVFLSAFSSASAGSINGSLRLPQPYSQTGSMQIVLRASSVDSTHSRQHLLTITQAQAMPSVLIAFSLDGLIDDEQYRLSYECFATNFPEPCMHIVGRGNYKTVNESVLNVEDATLIDGSLDTTNLEFPIITGITISGQVNMPEPFTAPTNGLNFRISANQFSATSILPEVPGFIDEGQNSGSYLITVPDNASESWSIRYRCLELINPNGACDDFVETAYYDSTAVDSTTTAIGNSEYLIGNQNHTNIDLALLSSSSISGVISAPFAPADVNGIDIRLFARDSSNSSFFDTRINIAQGETSNPFLINVPNDSNSTWEVSYACQIASTPIECENYLELGYFDSQTSLTMASPIRANADQLTGGQTHENINFSLLTGLSISGKLRLSQGRAPQGGVTFIISAIDSSPGGSSGSASVTIPEGANEVPYRISVADDPIALWNLRFSCLGLATPVCSDIANSGFYDSASGNTVTNQIDATPLLGGLDHDNIDLLVESTALADESFCIPIKTVRNHVAVICL